MTDTPSRYAHTGRKKVDRVCRECGSIVADTDKHDEWHHAILRLIKATAGLTVAFEERIHALEKTVEILSWEEPT